MRCWDGRMEYVAFARVSSWPAAAATSRIPVGAMAVSDTARTVAPMTDRATRRNRPVAGWGRRHAGLAVTACPGGADPAGPGRPREPMPTERHGPAVAGGVGA